jgi:hypothetical protein
MNTMHPTVRDGRIAGLWYLSLVVSGPFTLIYLPSKLIVRGDPSATVNNILAHETLFRIGIVADIVGSLFFLGLAFALHKLLKGVDNRLAAQMVTLIVVSVTIGFVNALNNLAVLILSLGSEFANVLDKHELDAIAMLFVRLHSQGNLVNEVLWGVWLWPFGVLVMRSGFLPKVLGVWLLINGFAYVLHSFTGLLAPQYANMLWNVAFPALFGELAIMLWLLIKGARVRPAVATAPA